MSAQVDTLAIGSTLAAGAATYHSIPPEAANELLNMIVTALMSLVTGVVIPSLRDWWKKRKERKDV